MNLLVAKPRLYRNQLAGDLLELSLVAATATFVLNRWLMEILGYPAQIRGELHFAHVLWGGLLMFIGSIIFMSYLGSTALRTAAFITGIGFALFIDEVGKFITVKNDYFYQPAMAIIYVTFIIFFLVMRRAQNVSHLNTEEVRLNKALYRKNKTQQPLYRKLVRYVAHNRLALVAVSGVMIVQLVTNIASLCFTILTPSIGTIHSLRGVSHDTAIIIVLVWLLSIAVGVGITVALLQSHVLRIHILHVFKLSILINIFIVDVYNFYQYQIAAVVGLFFNLFIYTVLAYAISQERLKTSSYKTTLIAK